MKRPEQQLQRAVAEHLRLRAQRDVWWAHCPNGGMRSAIEGAIFKSLGVRAGTPDLLLCKDGKLFALELKVLGGRLSAAQKVTHEELRRAGATVAVATGIAQALTILGEWKILPEGAE